MNMLFPSTKQRPDFHRARAAHSALFNPQLELNLCTNSFGPSHRDKWLQAFSLMVLNRTEGLGRR